MCIRDRKKGFRFVGAGVSGGEEGALNGASIMPGGSESAWPCLLYTSVFESSLGVDWHLQDRFMVSVEGFFKAPFVSRFASIGFLLCLTLQFLVQSLSEEVTLQVGEKEVVHLSVFPLQDLRCV